MHSVYITAMRSRLQPNPRLLHEEDKFPLFQFMAHMYCAWWKSCKFLNQTQGNKKGFAAQYLICIIKAEVAGISIPIL